MTLSKTLPQTQTPTQEIPNGLLAREGKAPLWRFIDAQGSFEARYPSAISGLYYPLCNEAGMLSAITPDMKGDLKMDQNHFFLKPVSVEDLADASWQRALWLQVHSGSMHDSALWNVADGVFPLRQLEIEETMAAGPGWVQVVRDNAALRLRAEWTSFVPSDPYLAECHLITIENTGAENIFFTAVPAVPVFARSADNLRDHRHVTNLLNRMKADEYGVVVQPTMSFDERGHQLNEHRYAVLATTTQKPKPDGLWLSQEDFMGEGGTLAMPMAMLERQDPPAAGSVRSDGKMALGAPLFKHLSLKPGESVTIALVLAISTKDGELSTLKQELLNVDKLRLQLEKTKAYWQARLDQVQVCSGDSSFDNWFRWIEFQPMLRKIYGCSFLPHFDYGRGGRGWRDLWQDCLGLLLTDPLKTPGLLEQNMAGVRLDGSNATIIGKAPGEFLADRNKISRTWMDHGVWPWLTLELYLNQTGDYDFLLRSQTYFKDQLIFRAKKIDTLWEPGYGTAQLLPDRSRYQGTLLEHVLVQHLVQFFNVGEHHMCLLEDADWNDGLDMAHDKGESVAFTAMYAGNLRRIAELLAYLAKARNLKMLSVFEELKFLLDRLSGNAIDYADLKAKRSRLTEYFVAVAHEISGKQAVIFVDQLVQDLKAKAEFLTQKINKSEWLDRDGVPSAYNGYYDNKGERLEGYDGKGHVRMTLTGQVFPVMSGVASPTQVESCIKAVKQVLFDPKIVGLRLNTDFKTPLLNMGRAFSFNYGDKENGAVFSHMVVMWANALYQRHYSAAGFQALDSLYRMALKSEQSRILPGLPEYFNGEGRGCYSYLTGSASWALLTIVTQMFGVRGKHGDLLLDPQLMPEQFDAQHQASIQTPFAGVILTVVYHNPEGLAAGRYGIAQVRHEKTSVAFTTDAKGGALIKAPLLTEKALPALRLDVDLAAV